MVNAQILKKFFKDKFGIPVSVRSGTGKGQWVGVRIRPEPSDNVHAPLVYPYEFPAVLGNQCLSIIYGDNPAIVERNFAGNVERHSISMHRHEWEKLLELMS